MQDHQLEGRVAIVTGSAAGFGEGIARPENRKRFVATISLGRLSRAPDVAAARLISGVEFPVDGARTV